VLLSEAVSSVWYRRAERSGRGRGESGFFSGGGEQRKKGGVGGPRGQAGDEEEVVFVTPSSVGVRGAEQRCFSRKC